MRINTAMTASVMVLVSIGHPFTGLIAGHRSRGGDPALTL
jgi:predicted benzoate:H+ symporter BenE